jgi:hypothetical protein
MGNTFGSDGVSANGRDSIRFSPSTREEQCRHRGDDRRRNRADHQRLHRRCAAHDAVVDVSSIDAGGGFIVSIDAEGRGSQIGRSSCPRDGVARLKRPLAAPGRGGQPGGALVADRSRAAAHLCLGMTPTASLASCIRLPSGTASRRFRSRQTPLRSAPSDASCRSASGRQEPW